MFARKFRLIRAERKMTLKQLAGYLNISISFLSDIEHGRRYPSIPTLLGICDKLSIQPSYFFDNDSSNDSKVSESDILTRIAYLELGDVILKELIDLDKLNIEDRKNILDHIKYVKFRSLEK